MHEVGKLVRDLIAPSIDVTFVDSFRQLFGRKSLRVLSVASIAFEAG